MGVFINLIWMNFKFYGMVHKGRWEILTSIPLIANQETFMVDDLRGLKGQLGSRHITQFLNLYCASL